MKSLNNNCKTQGCVCFCVSMQIWALGRLSFYLHQQNWRLAFGPDSQPSSVLEATSFYSTNWPNSLSVDIIFCIFTCSLFIFVNFQQGDILVLFLFLVCFDQYTPLEELQVLILLRMLNFNLPRALQVSPQSSCVFHFLYGNCLVARIDLFYI